MDNLPSPPYVIVQDEDEEDNKHNHIHQRLLQQLDQQQVRSRNCSGDTAQPRGVPHLGADLDDYEHLPCHEPPLKKEEY